MISEIPVEIEAVTKDMSIFSYGVCSSRYISLLAWKEKHALVPVGTNLVLWNLDTRKREKVFQYNTNAIMVLIENKRHIFSICYDGEVVIIDKEHLTLVDRLKSKHRLVRHATVNEDYFIFSAERGDHKGHTEVFSLKNLYDPNSMDKALVKIRDLEGRYRFCHLCDNHTFFIMKENILNEKELEQWENVDSKVDSKKPKPKTLIQYSMHNFSLKSEKSEPTTVILEHVNDIITTASNHRNIVAFMYIDRKLVIVNSQALDILATTKIAGSGAIINLAMHEDNVFFAPKNDYVLQIKVHDKLKLPDSVQHTEVHESIKVLNMKSFGVCPKNYAFTWRVPYQKAIAANEDGIFVLDFVEKKSHDISYFNITCCGLALSNDTKHVVSGDFSGNLLVYPTEHMLDVEPYFRTNIMEAVRTIVFDSMDQSIIVGTMSGRLIRWYYQDPMREPKQIALLDGSITNMRYSTFKDGDAYLIVGTASGLFAIYKEVFDSEYLTLILAHYGHLPKNVEEKHAFGSLHLFSEIWSTIWSPSTNDFLATCSEDQSCIIWDISTRNPKPIHTLQGHTKAVTSMDWKTMAGDLGEIFVSCSDDQTFRFYNPKKNFELLFIESTSFVKEWHTLTYLSLESNGRRVAIASQNGYLFIYDIPTKKFVYSEKVHTGSIEGLDWKGNVLVTCSSDNSINVIKLKQ